MNANEDYYGGLNIEALSTLLFESKISVKLPSPLEKTFDVVCASRLVVVMV